MLETGMKLHRILCRQCVLLCSKCAHIQYVPQEHLDQSHPAKPFFQQPYPSFQLFSLSDILGRFRVITQQCSHFQNNHGLTPLLSFFNDEQEVRRKFARTLARSGLAHAGVRPFGPGVWVDRSAWSKVQPRGSLCAMQATFTHAQNAKLRMRI